MLGVSLNFSPPTRTLESVLDVLGDALRVAREITLAVARGSPRRGRSCGRRVRRAAGAAATTGSGAGAAPPFLFFFLSGSGATGAMPSGIGTENGSSSAAAAAGREAAGGGRTFVSNLAFLPSHSLELRNFSL